MDKQLRKEKRHHYNFKDKLKTLKGKEKFLRSVCDENQREGEFALRNLLNVPNAATEIFNRINNVGKGDPFDKRTGFKFSIATYYPQKTEEEEEEKKEHHLKSPFINFDLDKRLKEFEEMFLKSERENNSMEGGNELSLGKSKKKNNQMVQA
ncbi:MAG: hypothetical protein MJ252_04730 [archaeon]|nr:hypothetical protein [archaeon]